MFKCDYHIHSSYSNDADKEASIESICEAAISKGVTDIAITDHFECNWLTPEELLQYDAASAHESVMSAKEKYKSKINLSYGIEIGQANQYPDAACELLRAHEYEFVIASIHRFFNMPDFKYLDFKKLSQEGKIGAFFEKYIDDLDEAVNVLPHVDSVAHLTYARRYCKLAGVEYDFTGHFSKVEKFFKKIISHEIALEINISTLWSGLGFTMPDENFLSLYRDCGGRIITIGTDAHSSSRVGECINETFAFLKRMGLNDILVVRNGKKEVIKI